MVLFKRKTVMTEPPKYTPKHPDQHVWFIPETLEYFCTYDAYLERMDFYMQKKFICELSGASCLTFFDARLKEQRETENVLERFPEPLKRPILAKVHMATITRLDQLVDELYGWLRDTFFVGEMVMVRFHDQRIRAEVIKADDGIYQVDDGRRILEGDASQLTRDRKIVSKLTLRAFIKHSASREQWVGAPWIVRQDYCVKYDLPQEIPPEIQRLYNMRAEEAAEDRSNNWVASSTENNHGGGRSISYDDDNADAVDSQEFTRQIGAYKSKLPMARKRLLKMLMAYSEPPQYKDDDLFRIARYAADDNLPQFVQAQTKSNPWPAWHEDSRLKELEEANQISHLIEVWLFSHLFREILDFDPQLLLNFDAFVDALRNPEVPAPLARLHQAIMCVFVPEGSSEMGIPLPQQADLEPPKHKRRAGRPSKKPKKNESEDDEMDVDDQEHDDEHDADATTNGETNGESHENGAKSESESEHEADDKQESEDEDRKDEITWIQRIGRRSFEDGEWQLILGQALTEFGYMREWQAETQEIAQLLIPPNQTPSASAAAEAYLKLSFAQRVHALMVIVRVIYSSPQLRDFLDARYEVLMKLRKLPLARELKQLGEDIRSVERVIALNELGAEGQVMEGSDYVKQERAKQVKYDFEVHDVEALKVTKANLQKLSEAKEKEVDEATRKIALMDNQRMRLLGKDRFFNRYWWMDANGISEEFIDSFAMGRLCVQGPAQEDLDRCLNSEEYAESFTEYRKKIQLESQRIKNERKLQYQQRRAAKLEQERRSTSLAPSTNSNASTPVPEQSLLDMPKLDPKTRIKQLKRRIEELSRINRMMQGLTAEETTEFRALQADLVLLGDPTYAPRPHSAARGRSSLGTQEPRINLDMSSDESHAQQASGQAERYTGSPKLESESDKISEQHRNLKQAQDQAQMQAQLSARVQAHFDAEIQAQTQIRASQQLPGQLQPPADPAIHPQIPVPQEAAPIGAPQLPYGMAQLPPPPPPGAASGLPPGAYPPGQPPYLGQPYPPTQGPVQWVVQQTTYGPMLYAVPTQQYQMLMQQYQQPNIPPGSNPDAYQAYLQQVALQQSYAAQQYPYLQGQGYPPPNMFGGAAPPPPPPPPQAAAIPPAQPAMIPPEAPPAVPVAAPGQQAPPSIPEPAPQAVPQTLPAGIVGSPAPQAPAQPAPAAASPIATPLQRVTNSHSVSTSSPAPMEDVIEGGSHPVLAQKQAQDGSPQGKTPAHSAQDVDNSEKAEAQKQGKFSEKDDTESLTDAGAGTVAQDHKAGDESIEDAKVAESVKAEEPNDGAKSDIEEEGLLVENKHEIDEEHEESDSESETENRPHPLTEIILTPKELLNEFQRGEILTSQSQWRFYDKPEEVQELVAYLFDLGGRETKLIEGLRKAEKGLRSSMEARMQTLGLTDKKPAETTSNSLDGEDDKHQSHTSDDDQI